MFIDLSIYKSIKNIKTLMNIFLFNSNNNYLEEL